MFPGRKISKILLARNKDDNVNKFKLHKKDNVLYHELSKEERQPSGAIVNDYLKTRTTVSY